MPPGIGYPPKRRSPEVKTSHLHDLTDDSLRRLQQETPAEFGPMGGVMRSMRGEKDTQAAKDRRLQKLITTEMRRRGLR